MTRVILILSALFIQLAASAGAQAQSFTVTAGEHADFTRIVVQGPIADDWSIGTTGRQRELALGTALARIDLSGVFDRIPRSRLAALRAIANGLSIELACDCDIQTWLDRPGLLILDIRSPLSPVTTSAERLSPPPVAPPPDSLELARRAGTALARAVLQPDDVATSTTPALAAADVGLPIARALVQGILDPATDYVQPRGSLIPDGQPHEGLPENLRIATVLDRAGPPSVDASALPPACSTASELNFLLEEQPESFGTAFGQLARDLYGEFDQPNSARRLALVQLYLASGFGAEARALIENSPDPILGRDLLIGMSDVLEGRSSNSRMRLAQVADCGGPVAIVALLAGEPTSLSVPDPFATALTFTQLPAPLRTILGPELAERFAAIGHVDAARIIVSALRRSPWTAPDRISVLDARLDQARGRSDIGLARLNDEAPDGLLALQTRLDLALETQVSPPPQILTDAEIIAGLDRQSLAGVDLMAAAIRLHALGATPEQGFAPLDRLATWIAETSENRGLLAELTDTLWSAVAGSADDVALARLILDRSDWRGTLLATSTRQNLGSRLLGLGLPGPVAPLLSGVERSPLTDRLLARAALAMGDPSQALAIVGEDSHPESRLLRAEALTLLGAPQDAAVELAALDAAPTLARTLILARDWRRLEQLPAGTWPDDAEMGGIEALLGRPPGHAQALSQVPTDVTRIAQPTEDQLAAAETPGAELGEDSVAGPAQPLTRTNPTPSGSVSEESPARVATPTVQSPPLVPGATEAPVSPAATTALAPLAVAPAGPTNQDRDASAVPEAPVVEQETGSGTDTTGPQAPARSTPEGDRGALAFDRLGLIGRSSTLLAESARLREALLPLLPAGTN